MNEVHKYDGRQVYVWLTQPWISMWFVHGPDRYNIFTFSAQDKVIGGSARKGFNKQC